MQRLYSKTTGSTYFKGFNTEIPTDAVEISEELYREVLANPAPGKLRSHDALGLPLLIDMPAMTAEQHAIVERQWRDHELQATKWLRERHRDEQDLALSTTLTPEQFAQLLAYLQQLRDWPQSSDFPALDHRPARPEWAVEHTL